ncbi:MAG: hypothetical protein PHI37_03860 [Candidatus Gracilibacteria bacterium]|nr:hypothetical protein [Candidatus Gracilibacteria bacterium]
MSSITINDLFDTCISLAGKSGLGDEEKFRKFTENFGSLIEDAITYQVYGDNPPEGGSFKIDGETTLKVETLLKINRDIEEYSYGDLLFSNFYALLETDEEKDIFEEMIGFEAQFGIENFRKFDKKHIVPATAEGTPLYKLLMLIYRGKTMEEAIDSILKENGIDVNVNPKIKLNPEIQDYISDFQNYVLGIITRSNGNFLMGESRAVN